MAGWAKLMIILHKTERLKLYVIYKKPRPKNELVAIEEKLTYNYKI